MASDFEIREQQSIYRARTLEIASTCLKLSQREDLALSDTERESLLRAGELLVLFAESLQ